MCVGGGEYVRGSRGVVLCHTEGSRVWGGWGEGAGGGGSM